MNLHRRLLALGCLVLILACGCRRATPDTPLPAVTVEATYAGANAQVVADTVAAPIEQQIGGVEKMVHLSSRCGNDGTCRVTVTFERGVDLNMAQVLVQNRVALAEPVLPDVVKRAGITVKKDSPGLLMIVALFSPDGSRDAVNLSNFAATQLKDELVRLPGTCAVTLLGQRDSSIRLWLDPDKLAARDLTAADIVRAIQAQNLQVADERPGKPPAGKEQTPIIVSSLGRLSDPEQFAEIIVKTDARGSVIRLKDVGRVEPSATGPESSMSVNGKPAVGLAVYPLTGTRAQDLSAAVQEKLGQLRWHYPPGLEDSIAFDFTPNLVAPGKATTPEYLLVDVDPPASASVQRTVEVLGRCERAARQVPGMKDVLALTDNPLDGVGGRPCIVVQLDPADSKRAGRDELLRTLRGRLGQEVPDVRLSLRDLSGPGGFLRQGYPIDLAVSGPEAEPVQKMARRLAERLSRDDQLTDVRENPDATPRPQLSLDVDRAKAKEMGVAPDDVFAALQIFFGSVYVNNVNGFGRTWQVQLQAAGELRDKPEKIKELKVRNANGEMVPLAALASVRATEGPEAINWLDGRPMVEITANPAPGVSLPRVRARCETLAEETRKELRLAEGYRLTWLRDMPLAGGRP